MELGRDHNGVEEEGRPRVGVVATPGVEVAERVLKAGGEPFLAAMPESPGGWGVALEREWVADMLEAELSAHRIDALVFEAGGPAGAAGAVIAAVRLKVPAVCLTPPEDTFGAALAALGFTPLSGEDPVEVALDIIGEKKLVSGRVVDSLALANALRVGVSLGAGPELLLHLAAIGKEADVVGFARVARVLIPETVEISTPKSDWFRENGLPALLDYLSEDLNDTRTVCGPLKELAREDAEPPPDDERFVHEFVRARSSGAEVLCRVPEGVAGISGKCLVFDSEQDAAENLVGRLAEFDEAQRTEKARSDETGNEDEDSETDSDAENTFETKPVKPERRSGTADDGDYAEEEIIAVVRGCGPRGVPGVRVLGDLARTISRHDLSGRVAVMTDGLAPEGALGLWASTFSPEASSGGVIGKLADGDFLKIDVEQGRILTSVDGKEIARRRSFRAPSSQRLAYAKRYAKSAQTIVDGASFG